MGINKTEKWENHTAAERYEIHQKDAEAFLAVIAEEMRSLSAAAAQHPDDWRYTQDMRDIRNALRDVARKILGARGWGNEEIESFLGNVHAS